MKIYEQPGRSDAAGDEYGTATGDDLERDRLSLDPNMKRRPLVLRKTGVLMSNAEPTWS